MRLIIIVSRLLIYRRYMCVTLFLSEPLEGDIIKANTLSSLSDVFA